jgi:PAS domain S-box-containing protein
MTAIYEWLKTSYEWLLGVAHYMPQEYILLWYPDVIALHVTSDVIIAASYFMILAGIAWLVEQRSDLVRGHRLLAWLFGVFILAGGVIHLIDAVTYWYPIYGLQGLAKVATAVISVFTVAFTLPMLPGLARLPSPRQLAEANESLRREIAAHESTLSELEAIRRELEQRVAERTRELSLVKARFETALRGAKVYVFSQDRDLRYTWVYNPRGEDVGATIHGRTDNEIFTSPDREAIIATKLRVLGNGEPEDTEVSYMMPEGRVVFAVHIEPTFGPDNSIDGIMCAAIDITRIRTLEREHRRLMEELATTLQRYEIAMQGSNVTVFTQDRELRYTSISNPLFGLGISEIVGRTDEDILPPANRQAIIAAKREVLESGHAKNQEIRIANDGTERWFDFHLEPMRDVAGAIVGLTCSAVDITERKEGESHLRLLMRELTHRSKNLLAVIQAMAHQTGRHAGSVNKFLDQFGERLQALAKSHDLLVQEGWQGASLGELVRSQLGHYLDQSGSQISVDGPSLRLKPEAAQNLGLALHEMATNAAKYGALSIPEGRVTISWSRRRASDGGGLEIQWTESGGPAVGTPKKRGFGSLVIQQNLARALDAEVEYDFAPDGVRCRIMIPEAHFIQTAATGAANVTVTKAARRKAKQDSNGT